MVRALPVLVLLVVSFACASAPRSPRSLEALTQLQVRQRAGLYHAQEWSVAGDSHKATFDRLRTWANDRGIFVLDAPLDRKSLLGYANRSQYLGWLVLINENLPPNNQLYTLLHELAHVYGPLKVLGAPAGETFAELVAGMVCQNLGLDVWRQTTAYVAGHQPMDEQTATVQQHGLAIDALVDTLTQAAQETR